MLFQSPTVSHLVSSCGCRTVQPPTAYLPAMDKGPMQLLQWHWALHVGTSTQPASMQAVISPECAVPLPKHTRLVPCWGVQDSHVDLASLAHCGDLPSGVADGSRVGDHGPCWIAPDANAEDTGSLPALYLASAFTVWFHLRYGTFASTSSLHWLHLCWQQWEPRNPAHILRDLILNWISSSLPGIARNCRHGLVRWISGIW